MKTAAPPFSEILLLSGGFIMLIAVQLVMAVPIFGDEFDYMSNVALLHRYGFGKSYLVNLVGSAGPLYSMVHFVFEPITQLKAPWVRLVNSGFLLAVCFTSYRILQHLRKPPPLFIFYAMAIPMTWVLAGLALTEMPAMCFFTFAVYLAIQQRLQHGQYQLLLSAAAGLCMSLAIIGRQPYLLTLAAFPLLFISKQNFRNGLLPLCLFLLCSVALPAYVFFTWKGLVPAVESQLYVNIANAGISYRPDFFVLCIFYLAAGMLLAAPQFFYWQLTRKGRIAAVLFSLAITCGNFIFHWIEWVPVKGLLDYLPGIQLAAYFLSAFTGGMVIILSSWFLACLGRHFLSGQYPVELVFFGTALVLVALACIKITWGYSSRYAGQAIPLLVMLGSFFYRRSRFNWIRISLGIITGLIALITYFPKK